jgi:hypothetical protein
MEHNELRFVLDGRLACNCSGWMPSVQRIWAEHDLKPHLVKSFKVSTDPNFAVKIEDIIGLYLDPPERALVLVIEPDSSSRPDPAGPAFEERPRRNHDP